MFGEPDPDPRATVEMSLGFLGDLVWRRLPEARPLVAERVVREMDDAMTVGRGIRRPTALSIVSDVLWSPLLRRALDASPIDRTLLARYLAVVREAYLSEASNDEVREALLIYVLDGLGSPEYLPVVEDVDRELFEIIRR
ncbi:MAG: hypothetical protein HOV94_41800 [Saccharothrix sp.]|nr:hypothetical protein [Saccharothrix sp.]